MANSFLPEELAVFAAAYKSPSLQINIVAAYVENGNRNKLRAYPLSSITEVLFSSESETMYDIAAMASFNVLWCFKWSRAVNDFNPKTKYNNLLFNLKVIFKITSNLDELVLY